MTESKAMRKKITIARIQFSLEMSFFDFTELSFSYRTGCKTLQISHVIIRPVTLNFWIHFCAGEILKTVTQLHTKWIIWFYWVKRDERAHWSVIRKPDRDTVLWTGTKIDMVLTEAEYVSLTRGVIWQCMTADRLHSLIFTHVYLPVRVCIDKAVKSHCVVSVFGSLRRFF